MCEAAVANQPRLAIEPSVPGSANGAPRALRVLHVLRELRPSGAEVMLRVAAAHFRHENADCEIVSTGEFAVGEYAQPLKDAGYIVHHLPFSRSIRFFRDLRRLVKHGRYDVVHLHAELASLYMMASVMPWARPVRTIHNNFTFTGWLARRRKVTRMLSRWLGVRQLAISPSVQATESEYFSNPTELCLNWYDSDYFRLPTEQERVAARTSLGLSRDDLAVISIGNCSAVKNHMAIIEGLGQLDGSSAIVYLHAGRETTHREERETAIRLGLDAQVRFLGVLSDVRPLLYAADLLIMPSQFEGLPISLLESLACGVPALLADVPGLKEFREWFPGLLYCEPNASDLARKLKQFADTPAVERGKQSSVWAETARRTFGVTEGVKRYVAVYNSALRDRSASR